jgi:hypothetical protein
VPIDPARKIAQQEKRREAQRLRAAAHYKATKVLKAGNLTRAEKAIVAQVVQENPTPAPAQVTALSTILQRKPQSIKNAIAAARERFQSYAMDYVESHHKTLASSDPDVARKAAQWAIEHLSTRDKDGNMERIVEAAESADERPNISIGIQLGGMPARSSPQQAIDAEVEDE